VEGTWWTQDSKGVIWTKSKDSPILDFWERQAPRKVAEAKKVSEKKCEQEAALSGVAVQADAELEEKAVLEEEDEEDLEEEDDASEELEEDESDLSDEEPSGAKYFERSAE